MLAVQQFLRSGGTLAELTSRYAIKAKRHPKHAQLVHLKYDQIASVMSEPMVQECRALVLDESDDWNIIAHPFHKFFNHGEGPAAVIDWTTARVQEKVDGSLCVLYFYADEWHVATTGTPDAGGKVAQIAGDQSLITFRDLFMDTLSARGIPLPVVTSQTYMLELTTPENRVVVPHSERNVTLLGARGMNGIEMTPQEAAVLWGLNHPQLVRSFALQSIADIETSFETMRPLAQEGYVVVDAAFNRVKVKHPGYVAIHHAISSLSNRALAEIVRRGEQSEVEAHFPEVAKLLRGIREKHVAVLGVVRHDFATIGEQPTQKDFALLATKCAHPAALFQMRKGIAPEQHFADAPIDTYLRAIGMKDVPAKEAVE